MRSWHLVSSLLASILVNPPSHSGELTVPNILDEKALMDGKDGRPRTEPCHDFYQFSCGNWLRESEIPSDRSSIYHQSTALFDQTEKQLNQILEGFAQNDSKVATANSKKLSDVYSTCMNRGINSSASIKLLRKLINEINQIENNKDLAREVARLHLLGVDAYFTFYSDIDLNDSNRVIGVAAQGGIGLPDQAYYLNTDERSLEIIERYKKHISSFLQIAGTEHEAAVSLSKRIFEFEKTLAASSYTLNDKWDPAKINHLINREGLITKTPLFQWVTYFNSIGLSKVQAINVNHPEFFEGLNRLFNDPKYDLDFHKYYLTWQLLDRAGVFSGAEFETESFEFHNKFMSGEKTMKTLWKQCTRLIQQDLGYALAESYVKTLDAEAIIKRINAMIVQILDAFKKDLHALTYGTEAWIDVPTYNRALEKLSLIKQKVGSPEKWLNYSSLNVSTESYLKNSLATSVYNKRRNLAKIGNTPNRDEWYMMPWEINAYFDSNQNEFVFPFGILQPPSFDLNASEGANLGAFGGGTIGHELTHGYDDDGRKYDGHGNVKEWWSKKTEEEFNTRSRCFIDQANEYPVKAGDKVLHMNGEAALSENLADQGGVKIAYQALDESLKIRAETPWLGYTERQQYWIAYAQSWCVKTTTASMELHVGTDTHPPAEFRVNGVMMNRPEFANDFGCKTGDAMAPAKRCSIW